MAFIAFRVMRFYGLSHRELLELPMRTFWAMDAKIGPIRADEDLRRLQVAGAAQSGEGASRLHEALNRERGEPVRKPPEQFDRAGMKRLMAKLGNVVPVSSIKRKNSQE